MDPASRETRLAALARSGALLQGAQRDEGVWRAVREGLAALELRAALLVPAGRELRVAFVEAPAERVQRWEELLGGRLEELCRPWTQPLRAAWRDGESHAENWDCEVARFLCPGGEGAFPPGGEAQGIVVRIDAGGEPAALLVAAGEWLRRDDLPAFRHFGARISAALGGARTARALPDRLAELTLRVADLEAANAHLRAEAQRRVEEVGLLLEVGRSLVATLDLNQILDAGARNLARIVGAPDAYLVLVDESGERLVTRAATGSRAELLGATLPVRPPASSLAALVVDRREPVVVEDAEADPRSRPELRRMYRARALLGLPLVVRGRTIGAAMIIDPDAPRRFTAPEVERAAAIANQLAVAADNARLYDDLRRSYAELARTQEQLVHRERLAALGELAALVAHEVRNPLGVIFNSLGALRRMVKSGGDTRMLFDIVGEEADRLNRIVGDLLDFARPRRPSIRPEPLERILEEAVAAAAAQAPRALEVVRDVEPGLPPVPADARQLRQALVNVAQNAVQAMPQGGRLTVRARRDGAFVRIEIADSGPGVPDELRQRIFEPFFTTRASGTGLGLAVVRRVAEDHRGTAEVEAAAGGGAAFVLRLPLDLPRVENPPGLG